MDYSTFQPYAQDAERTVQVFIYPRGYSTLQIRLGQAAAVAFELTPFVAKLTQQPQQTDITLAWHNELYDAATQPTIGMSVEVRLDGKTLWLGYVYGISDFNLRTGTKTMTLTVRTVDASPAWRTFQRSTNLYSINTPLTYILQQVTQACGVDPLDFLIPTLPVYTVQSTTQLAQMALWDILTALLQPCGFDPYINALGQLKAVSRDTTRVADLVLDDSRLVSVNGSKSKPPVNVVRINWLDPNLATSSQVTRKLAETTISTGFFMFKHKQDVWFSSDGSQRAHNTFLITRQSANSGLLPTCTENYTQLTDQLGRIELDTLYWSPALVAGSFAAQMLASFIPDGLDYVHDITIPAGKPLHAGAVLAMALVMMSIGTGVYEIWGQPFSYVHNRNKTDAYDSKMETWEEQLNEISTDFVMNEDMAKAYATRELIYQSRAASQWSVTIVDDPRIEKGDILQLQDGSRLYVTNYTRDLSMGAAALLKVDGFRC